MLIIQIVAGVLLLLGSGLIFKALAEIEAPNRPRSFVRPRPDPVEAEYVQGSAPVRLPRAA